MDIRITEIPAYDLQDGAMDAAWKDGRPAQLQLQSLLLRKNTVFGQGNRQSPWLHWRGPGAEEDHRLAFVGRAGQFLTDSFVCGHLQEDVFMRTW